MKIRSKLLLLAVGSQMMMVFAVVLYFFILAPIDELQKENAYFQAAAKKASNLLSETNKLTSQEITAQFMLFTQANTEYNQAVDDMNKIVRLRVINETMLAAVESVGQLRDLSVSSMESISKAMTDLQSDIVNLPNAASTIDFANLIMMSSLPDVPQDVKTIIQYHTAALLNAIKIANDTLAMTVKVIQEKDSIVAEEVIAIKTQSNIVALAILVLLLAGVLAISILMATGIARALSGLSRTVGIMSTGDLTQRFGTSRKDEIGHLGQDLDKMLGSLNASLGQIQAASRQNTLMRDDLVRIVAESSSSAVQIEANSDSIRSQMVRMDSMLAGAVQEIGGMIASINGFHERLGIQNHHVSETVAAVTQMLASIENIDRITERDRQSAEELVSESEQSKEIFDNAFEKVAEITDSVSAIQEMASVIAGIANQTNILAMNAAIEAAHAGEFGKGFAVVADEIGKLATASALSSDEIAHTISSIVVKMNEAGATRETTTRAFGVISQKIREVSESIAEIYSNVNEMQSGSKQILNAMESLRTTSAQITEESAQIEKTTQGIGTTMTDLGRISHEVTSNIAEIGTGVQLISQSMRNVSDHTDQMRGIGQNLDAAIAIFKTDNSEVKEVDPV